MSMSDKKLSSLSFLFDPPPHPQNYSAKKLKSFVMFHNQDIQKSKLYYVHSREVYLVDLTKKSQNIRLWTMQGLALIHDHITVLCINSL